MIVVLSVAVVVALVVPVYYGVTGFTFTVGDGVQALLIAVSIVAAALLALLIVRLVRARGNVTGSRRVRVGRWVGRIAVSLLILTVVGANVGVLITNNVLNQFFQGSSTVDEGRLAAAAASSRETVEDIVDEGIVLVKNKDAALPLTSDETKVNLFGIASAELTYGGSGSGGSDEDANVSLAEGLQNAGLSVNEDLLSFYEENLPEDAETNIHEMAGGDYRVKEVGADDLPSDLISGALSYSGIAVITLARNGGEGGDLPTDMGAIEGGTPGRSYLELTEPEEELIATVTGAGFDKVIVLINSSNAMELGFLEQDGIDAALWIGGPGATGANSVGSVIAGTVNPSGRLTDTYAYDALSAPAVQNAGAFLYTNEDVKLGRAGTAGAEGSPHAFVDYAEGIYVGYRYYETRYVDNATGQVDEAAYAAAVQYPFGYGLSYTSFAQRIVSQDESDGVITVNVEVTNTGDVAGKDVAQIYVHAPYAVGGVEKSHVVLVGFDKTETLEPGQSETLAVSFRVDDMASYDVSGDGAYVLDAGTYGIRLSENAHDVIDSFDYTVGETVVYGQDNPRSGDDVAATNEFAAAAGDVAYVSRADWAGTVPTTRTTDKEASAEVVAQLDDLTLTYPQSFADAEPITVRDNGVKLEQLAGLDYDDPLWDDLLQQLSVDDMSRLVGTGAYGTIQINSVTSPQTSNLDGPAGLNALTSGVTGVQYPSETLIAATWNTDAVEKMAESLSAEMLAHQVVGLYGPGANIHRTPFSGRNFEYYSEDAYLSGSMGAVFAKSLQDGGITTYPKHFALNDQETNRYGLAVWSNEQAIRELYLKPFEMIVKDGGTRGMMTAHNRIGSAWTGADNALLNVVLRDEWGFRGVVVTDMSVFPHQDQDMAVANGNDLMLAPLPRTPTDAITQSAEGQQALRVASHNILYSVANSAAFDVWSNPLPRWLLLYGIGNGVALGALAYGVVALTRKRRESPVTVSTP